MLRSPMVNPLANIQEALKEWKDKYDQNALVPSDLYKYLMSVSPFLLSIELLPEHQLYENEEEPNSECDRPIFDEVGGKTAIIDVLEELICGDNPQLILERMKTEDNIPSVCGRVFKNGEPTYSCRECSMDPTCVLCANCFAKSTHRNHKYKMATSGGGGCCDCGDKEAWKQDPYCEEHFLGVSTPSEGSNCVTERMKKMCAIVFRGVLKFCMHAFQIHGDGMEISDYEEGTCCTILYNDEVHTFDQVIQILTTIVKCNQKLAFEYVTSIDRDGRAVVKCASHSTCKKIQQEIERKAVRTTLSTKALPLRVDVLHKDSVACQYVAMFMLGWFQEFLTKHRVFRAIFTEVICEQNTNFHLKHILKNDAKLWKEARNCWHHLMISGLLMEYENKKIFADIFTKHYPELMQEFIRDDHFHSISIVSMSVQLYTVPTIAQHLIAHMDAFFKLLHTFYAESIEKFVKNNVLQFEKNTSAHNLFKRAVYILTDLKYLLTFKPDTWTDELRRGFLHGMQPLIRFMKVMQGMDAVTRQVGQHMEYEPEWESAFTLQIKLSVIISLALEWCGSDRTVLIKVYRDVVNALMETKFITSQAKGEVRELADHSTACLQYDVLVKPVSIHLPLTRFYAGLYTNLEKFGLTFDSDVLNGEKPTPEKMVEPVLCTRTMIAQVHAGMWRRNGYSLQNQIYFYRNVKCRAEMLDRDITAMQVGAALIESNDYLIQIMNKFNLLNWAAPNYEPSTTGTEEDGIRQISNMIDEFLELLIIITGERYTPGIGRVTNDDCMRKEIIQQLCIKPFSHSELLRCINDELNGETDLENVINDVAVFKKPSQSDKKGVFQLKEEYFEDYNMYFYHYSKEDKSKSEESQRKRRQEKRDLVCCPPPKLPKLTESFNMIANMLHCDVMLHVMQTVLKRGLDLKAITFSESHLAKILHLIGYALQEEESGNYSFLLFESRAANWGLLPLLEELAKCPRVESQRDLILWVIRKFKEVKQCKNNVTSTTDESMRGDMETELIVAESQLSAAAAEKAQKEERAKLAAQRRAQILAQMASAQKNFMAENSEMFKEAEEKAGPSNLAGMEWQEVPTAETKSCCLGPDRKVVKLEDKTYTCILCSEDSTVGRVCMVYPAFIQKSSVLSRYQKTNEGVLQYLETTIHPSPHISTCGHVMHIGCYKEYFANEVNKEHRRPYRQRNPTPFDIDKKEFLCPLCRFLSNSVLPLVPALPAFEDKTDFKHAATAIEFDYWLELMDNLSQNLPSIAGDGDKENEQMTAAYKEHFIAVINKKFDLNVTVPETDAPLGEIVGENLNENIVKFVETIQTISPYYVPNPFSENFLVTWLSCGYTIESLEMLLRATEKPLKGEMSIRYTCCLSGLVRLSGILCARNSRSNSFLLSHLKSLINFLFARDSVCVLVWDIFGLMVMLMFTTRAALAAGRGEGSVPKGENLEFAIVKAVFLATIARIVIGYEPTDDMDVDMDFELVSMETEASDNLLKYYRKFNIYRGDGENHPKVTSKTLTDQIKYQCQTFLRCSCLLFHFMTDVELPDELSYLGGDTFEVMTSYLGLSEDIGSYFTDRTCLNFMHRLAEHPDIIEFKRKLQESPAPDEIVPIVSPVTPIRQLITLPNDYIDVINSVSLFTCSNNEKDESRNPSMCLVCGEILCSQTYCCQKEMEPGKTVGACTYHMHTCGAGIGMFLRIRDAEILLLGPNKGAFISAPYLDDYGETDQGLRRGNPLRLCKDRYRKLHLMWLSHGIHEEIVRMSESPASVYATQWSNF